MVFFMRRFQVLLRYMELYIRCVFFFLDILCSVSIDLFVCLF